MGVAVDKSAWGPGPWQDEPDKVQWTDKATGLPCLIVRNPRHGNLCGYVGVDATHPCYRVDYSEVDVEVHGGLSYAALRPTGADGGLHTLWWFGFDCGHWRDIAPGLDALLRERHLDPLDIPDDGPEWMRRRYRPIGYVRDEVTQLARQLAELG